MYWVVSITNKQEPLSACLMVIELSFCRDFSLSGFFLSDFLSFVLVPYRQCGSEPFRVAVQCLGKLGAVHVCFGLGRCGVVVLGCDRRRLVSKREGRVFVKKEYCSLKHVR